MKEGREVFVETTEFSWKREDCGICRKMGIRF